MKKRCFAVLLVLVLFVSIIFPFGEKSYAVGDPLTIDLISGALYSMMSSWGIVFSTTDATAQGVGGILNQLVYDYCDYKGGNLADIFYGKIIVDALGKLSVSYQIYNTAIDFVNWMKDRFTGNGITLGEDSAGYIYAGTNAGDSEIPGGYTIYFSNSNTFDWGTGYDRVFYSKGTQSSTIATGNANYTYLDEWSYDSIDTQYNRILIKLHSVYKSDGRTRSFAAGAIPLGDATLTNIMNWDNSSYSDPTEITEYQGWEGDIEGVSEPGITLQDLIDAIYDAIKDNILDVDGEVVEIGPEPTPVPTYPPAENILDGVNTQIEQLNDIAQDFGGLKQGLDDLNDLTAEQKQILEDIGIDIGGLKQGLDDLNDLTAEQKQVLEDIGIDIGVLSEALDDINDLITAQNQAIGEIEDDVSAVSGAIDQAISDVEGAIAGQTTAISGAIDQAVKDVAEAIGEQTATLDVSLTATAEGVQDIADALQSGEIEPKKFDLRGLFPFCIPFDIHNLLQKFDAEPVAPHVQLPFVIDSIGFSYMIDLDFSAFDTLAAAVRSVEYIVFAIGLAWATSKVIKW